MDCHLGRSARTPASRLGDAVFEAWIGPLVLVDATNGELKLGAPRPFARNWVANQYAARIERAIRAEGSEPASLSIVLAPQKPAAGAVLSKESLPKPIPATISYLQEQVEAKDRFGEARRTLSNRVLDPMQTFDSFIPGTANEFGHGAARALAEAPRRSAAALHPWRLRLRQDASVERRGARSKRGKRVLFLRAEDFMRHFLGALYRKDTLAFKEELRTADVLIIDDLQHICRSTATASEFLYTVNAFADLRRRVVIAADRPPPPLESLGADMKSRMTGGLVIELDKPDRDTRLAILKSRAAEYTRRRPERPAGRRARTHRRHGRRQPARDDRRIHQARHLRRPDQEAGDAGNGRGSRGPARRSAGPKTSIEDIQRKTAEFYKLDVKDFYSPQRARRVARPRQVAMYLARKLTTRSLPEIGRRFGGRDHTTVLHACRRIEALCAEILSSSRKSIS